MTRALPPRTGALGAGAGNSPTEVLIAVYDRLGVETGVDLNGILAAAEEVVLGDLPLGITGRSCPRLPDIRRAAERIVLSDAPGVPEPPLCGRYVRGPPEEVDLGKTLLRRFPRHPVHCRSFGMVEEIEQRINRRRPDHHKRVRRPLPDVLRRISERPDERVHSPPFAQRAEGKGGIAADGRIASLQCFGQAVDISPRRHAFKIISLLLP